MDKLFQIGNFCFRILCSDEITLPRHFLLFEVEQGIEEHTYYVYNRDILPSADGKIIAKRSDLIVYEAHDGENRLIGIKGEKNYYAYYCEKSERRSDIFLNSDGMSDLHIDSVFTSLFALERQMIKKNQLIFHCAYIEYQGKAILFSAPSETGKSTQAELWEQYRGARTINGDRALLRKIDDRWTACGWPVCGSSEICNIGDTPICAIVMLRQGKINQLEHLSPLQAFTQLYAQITINQWNRNFVQRAILNLEDLIQSVPVYQLTCDISEDAVKCLENTIFSKK